MFLLFDYCICVLEYRSRSRSPSLISSEKLCVLFNDAVNCSDYAGLRIDECVLGTAGTTGTGRNEITRRKISTRARGSALESVPGFRRERRTRHPETRHRSCPFASPCVDKTRLDRQTYLMSYQLF